MSESSLDKVRAGTLRMVGTQRKRKLRKKGISVWWCHSLQSYVWEPAAIAKATGEKQ